MPLLSKHTAREEQTRVESAWETLRTLIYAILLALLFRSLLFEPFHIPSGSMRSTLLEGDYIFVSKYAYGYSRYSFPFGAAVDYFDGRLWQSQPERGDVAVFRLPSDTSIDYIKRIIGLPGDTIQVKDGRLLLNGEAVTRKQVKDYAFHAGGIEKRITRYRETLPNGESFHTLDETQFGEVDYTEKYTVPKKHYFVMGDNRDNSIDSRYNRQVGFIPAENLIGRAEIVLFSIDKHVNFAFWEFWKYPYMFRSGRFVLEIE